MSDFRNVIYFRFWESKKVAVLRENNAGIKTLELPPKGLHAMQLSS